MGIKDLISSFGSAGRERANKIKELDESVRIQKLVHERQLSNNERELIGYKKEKHEKMVDRLVERERKRKTNEFLHGPKTYQHKNIFKGQKSIMTGQRSLLRQERIF